MTSLGILLSSIPTVALHEAGHIVTAYVLGLSVKRIGLSWKGVYIVREQGDPTANIIVTLAGPLVNLFLAFEFWTVVSSFAWANLVLGVFNLLPVSQSDGERAWRLIREATTRSLDKPKAPTV